MAARSPHRQLDLALLLDRLLGRELALAHRAADQEPRGKLHQPRGEPHALGGVGQRMRRPQLARLFPAVAVEIGRGRLDQRHAFAKHCLELI